MENDVVAMQRAAIERELQFYDEEAPPPFMAEAIERRRQWLRERLAELGE